MPQKLFHLNAAPVTSDSPVAPPADLPAEVAGQPVTYFWKEMIHVGDYTHPEEHFSLDVDAQRLARWADVGSRMLSAGLAIPINCDHSDRARDVVGYVKQFKRDGDRLLGLCQFIGPDAALLASRNLVSVGIDADFTDGQANTWGEAIVHLALTPVPVVPNQGAFIEAGGEKLAQLNADLSAAKLEIARLSARLPQHMPQEAQEALIEAAITTFDTAVARGGLSPIARDRLISTLVRADDGQVNLIALSRSSTPRGDRALALAIADILLDNPPITLGESTNLQSAARATPGEDASPMMQLQQYMTRMASK